MANHFTFRKPVFVRFDYVPVVIENKAFLLFTWELKYASRLRIKSLHFKSRSLKGSAYAKINGMPSFIKIRITSWFRSTTLKIPVISIPGGQFSFQPIVLPNKQPLLIGLQKEARMFAPFFKSFAPKVIEFYLPE